ncbi:LemA family protein [Providencia huaxiensis]|uniref:LemA family protein n=1 Tax=Providencia huaxiensis TaxID=2027290 RepID=A0ABU2ITZ6_9GAMM|nr:MULTISPECIES: LemA family protein [Providencia]MCG9536490.1 LemA family protein [Providencia huaxiensis]MDI7240808.1 LemA family protein [Providencia huaxiensis]MDT0132543.1 LemA family protein [Providencia huaxiensis]MDT1978949.1 LemA family protein [Providencia huaxiensis]
MAFIHLTQITYLGLKRINMTITLIVVFVLLLLAVGWGISIYNRLINARNQVSNQFANIDVILKQRADQIPQLVTITEKAMEHEKTLFTSLSDARQRYFNAQNMHEKIAASNEMNRALSSLVAIAENYPTLISGEQFTQLQIALSEVENKIAQRREGFNDATTEYNTAIQMFPDSLIANAFRFTALPLLDISEDEKKYHGVQFK